MTVSRPEWFPKWFPNCWIVDRSGKGIEVKAAPVLAFLDFDRSVDRAPCKR